MVFQQTLIPLFQDAFRQLYHMDVPVNKLLIKATRKEFEGTHTLLLFPLIPFVGKNAAVVGEEVGTWMKTHHSHLVAAFHVVHAFLNLRLADAAWLSLLARQEKDGVHVAEPKKIIIEIACPNTNKPLHLGHLRNSFIGDAVANILCAVGHDVKKLMHVNDRGIHICKSMHAYQQDANAKIPATVGVKGDHFVGDYYVAFDRQHKKEVAVLVERGVSLEKAKKAAPSMVAIQTMLQKWEEGDPATLRLWETMNGWVYEGFNATYARLGITFDKTYYESHTYLLGKEVVKEGLSRGIFYQKKDGAVWVDVQKGKNKKLLLRADGTAVYITQDLGTADLRQTDFEADQSIYVVGNEQDYHFVTLFAILQKLGRIYASSLVHLSYGMVELPDGRMKSREGTVVDADDLIDEMVVIAKKQTASLGKIGDFSPAERETLYHTLAIGALKFFLLKVSPQKRVCFDPSQSIKFQGHTGPFIQYTYARIATLLTKATAANLDYTACSTDYTVLSNGERALIAQLAQCSDMLHQAALALDPSVVAQYLFHIAKAYNQLYAQQAILQEKHEEKRRNKLYLSYYTQEHLRRMAALLGIRLPSRM